MGYVFNIAKQGKSVLGASPKDLVFSSQNTQPSLKILAGGKREFTINSEQTITYEESFNVSFPIVPFIFIYQPVLGKYKLASPIALLSYFGDYFHCSYEFDTSKIYVTISNYTGAQRSSHYIWFICFA